MSVQESGNGGAKEALTTHTNGFLGTPGAGGSQLGGSCSFGFPVDSEPATETTFGECTASMPSGTLRSPPITLSESQAKHDALAVDGVSLTCEEGSKLAF